MKKILAILLTIIFLLTACDISIRQTPTEKEKSTATAYLYGEQHGFKAILDKEYELWYDYYHKDFMRHLFVELPFYGAEFLNIWMISDDNTILDEIFFDIKGTAMDTPENKEFFIKIKKECPETIFHGIDVGHAYETMGKRYLEYLTNNNLKSSTQYALAEKAVKQGETYYKESSDAYREEMLIENFKYAFNLLENQNIMGIFGSAHIHLDAEIAKGTKNMATQLKEYYGENIMADDLTYLAKEMNALKIDTVTINGKEYQASYFGKQDLSKLIPELSHREFWKVENAYEDLSPAEAVGNVLPLGNYPMNLELNSIYILVYTKKDGTTLREIHRYDGYEWNGQKATEQIAID